MPLPTIVNSSDERNSDCVCTQEADCLLQLKERLSVDQLWPGLEKYLFDKAHIIRSSAAGPADCLKCARHRMTWHAVIYYACRSSTENSAEIYHRLLLFLLVDLETNVIRPFINKKNALCSNRVLSRGFCCEFVEHYKRFMTFGCVVFSCFNSLDFCYAEKYGLDSISAVCVKMFYAAVYKPMSELIVNEVINLANEVRERRQNGDECFLELSADVQKVLVVIREIIFKVRKFSFLHMEEQNSMCVKKRDGLDVVRHATTFSDELTEKNAPAKGESVWSFFSDGGSSCCLGAGEGYGNFHATKAADITTSSLLDGISLLRAKLEKSLCHEAIAAGQATMGNAIINGGREGGNAKSSTDSPAVLIASLRQPLHSLVLAEFGVRYVRAAEDYYRVQRETQLATFAGRRDYMRWVQGSLDFEWLLVNQVNVVQFFALLREQIFYVLLVEVYQIIILDKEVGFCAQLTAWEEKSREKKVSSGDFWEQFSREELSCHICSFVTAFVNTQNKVCWALLASEFTCKLVMDIATLFFTYMSRVDLPKQEPFVTSAHSHCQGSLVGVENCKKNESAVMLIEGVVDLSLRYGRLVKEQFNDHQPMRAAMNDVLRAMLNPERWSQLKAQIAGFDVGVAAKKTAEMVDKLETTRGTCELPIALFFAVYCDQLCKGEMMCISSLLGDCSEIAVISDHIASLVEFFDNKDVFFEHYKLLLAHRLLTPSSTHKLDLGKEHVLVCSLQQCLKHSMAYTLKAMLQDYESSFEICEEFCQTPAYSLLGAKLKVRVINSVHWPKYRLVHISPCDSLCHAMKAFTDHYGKIHSSRTLHWIHTVGSAVLHAVFPNGEKKIISNIIQANILVIVSDACNAESNREVSWPLRSISGRKIAATMEMAFSDVSPHLTLLVQHELYNILQRVEPQLNNAPAESTLSTCVSSPAAPQPLMPDDEFTLNLNYTHKSSMFKLPAARFLKKRYYKKNATSFVYEDNLPGVLSTSNDEIRRLQMDAVIIGIMKRSGSLRYHELLEATARQLPPERFALSLHNIKRQVENLIGRGFLRRAETDSSVLEYVA